jgi:hypothetical protein
VVRFWCYERPVAASSSICGQGWPGRLYGVALALMAALFWKQFGDTVGDITDRNGEDDDDRTATGDRLEL